MNKRTVLLTIESILCIIAAAVLIVSDFSIYQKGLTARMENPMADIYTAEAIADKAVFVLPLFVLIVIVLSSCQLNCYFIDLCVVVIIRYSVHIVKKSSDVLAAVSLVTVNIALIFRLVVIFKLVLIVCTYHITYIFKSSLEFIRYG